MPWLQCCDSFPSERIQAGPQLLNLIFPVSRILWQGRIVGPLTWIVGRSWIGLIAVVQLEAEVIPDDSGGDISGGNREGNLILACLHQSGVELLDVLVPDTLIGVVAQSVGGDGMDGADGLSVDAYDQPALHI